MKNIIEYVIEIKSCHKHQLLLYLEPIPYEDRRWSPILHEDSRTPPMLADDYRDILNFMSSVSL